MISFLEGTLSEAWPTRAVINCQGIGYELLIPVTPYDRLPQPNEKVRLLTHLVVREDFRFLILDLWACGRAITENRPCLALAEATKGFPDEVT